MSGVMPQKHGSPQGFWDKKPPSPMAEIGTGCTLTRQAPSNETATDIQISDETVKVRVAMIVMFD